MAGEPIPPVHLTARMMHGPGVEAARAKYLERGRQSREEIEALLPDDWTWAGKTVLDFGCGAGRTIRHFAPRAPECELWGSDIDPGCIEWNQQHLSPALSFVVNEEVPPLPFPAGKFDLIYALSVFTHITALWAGWLLELDRMLAPGGRLLLTFMGDGMYEPVAGEPLDESEVGMTVYEAGQGWDLGGPMVLHSPWWIEEHWGRLFEIERLVPRRSDIRSLGTGQDDHGVAVLSKTSRSPSIDELERIDPTEAREATALHHEVQHLRAEVAGLRAEVTGLRSQAAAPPAPVSGRQGLAAVRAAVRRRLRRFAPGARST
jgi:SAM-dependent methyltransferase